MWFEVGKDLLIVVSISLGAAFLMGYWESKMPSIEVEDELNG